MDTFLGLLPVLIAVPAAAAVLPGLTRRARLTRRLGQEFELIEKAPESMKSELEAHAEGTWHALREHTAPPPEGAPPAWLHYVLGSIVLALTGVTVLLAAQRQRFEAGVGVEAANLAASLVAALTAAAIPLAVRALRRSREARLRAEEDKAKQKLYDAVRASRRTK